MFAETIGQAITARAMNGELDFTESLRARVALLKGTPADVFERIKPNITLTRGARELCRALKRLGYKLALLSGGFIPLAKWLQKELGLDYVFANTVSFQIPMLAVVDVLRSPRTAEGGNPPATLTTADLVKQLSVSEDGIQLTGELSGPIVDPKRKAALLEEIASTEGVPLRQVFAVGDGANDLLMLNKAGLGVAFNAKPIVQLKVRFDVSFWLSCLSVGSMSINHSTMQHLPSLRHIAAPAETRPRKILMQPLSPLEQCTVYCSSQYRQPPGHSLHPRPHQGGATSPRLYMIRPPLTRTRRVCWRHCCFPECPGQLRRQPSLVQRPR